MGISLKKGQGVSLKKESASLTRLTIGLGWDVAKPKGLLNKIFAKSETLRSRRDLLHAGCRWLRSKSR